MYSRGHLALGSVRTGCVGSWFLRGVYRRSRLSSWGCTYFRGRPVLGNAIACRCGRHAFASVPTVNRSTRRPDARYTSKNRWNTTAGETSKTTVGALPRTMTTKVGLLPRYTSKHPDCSGAYNYRTMTTTYHNGRYTSKTLHTLPRIKAITTVDTPSKTAVGTLPRTGDHTLHALPRARQPRW